jgi:hypothetical protein
MRMLGTVPVDADVFLKLLNTKTNPWIYLILQNIKQNI